ncbi:hypothetical protein [Streptomyces sp. TP-A0356]|uniref:hypothetical protein n=1 Tax=Streptomyces sp. TP-A0356 TaxID=1359208 RepID=UPI0006E39D03|nr:hypothetical protein [Streptomyces sp. TP-A0356]
MRQRIDLLVHGGDVLTVDDAGTVVSDGAVAVRDGGGNPAEGPAAAPRPRYTADEDIDAEGTTCGPRSRTRRTRGKVPDTLVDGRILMRERVLTTLDQAAAVAESEALARAHDTGGPTSAFGDGFPG